MFEIDRSSYRPADLSRAAECSVSLIRHIESDLGIDPIRVGPQRQRRYSLTEAEMIVAEARRRKDPAQSLRLEAVA